MDEKEKDKPVRKQNSTFFHDRTNELSHSVSTLKCRKKGKEKEKEASDLQV